MAQFDRKHWFVSPRHIFPDSDTTKPSCWAVWQHQDDHDLKPVINTEQNAEKCTHMIHALDNAEQECNVNNAG